MKRLLIATLLVLLLACKREAPQPAESFLISFKMPEECLQSARYKGQKVVISGATSYEFVTDAGGMITVSDLIPGIYDIITSWEMSGADYKVLVKDPLTVDAKARVIVGVSLMNQRIFSGQDLEIDLTSAVVRGLMISKLYYSGTKDQDAKNYTKDAYIEIFNNAEEVAYLDGKYLGLANSRSNTTYMYTVSESPDSIHLKQVCRFPGNGTDYPVQPGASVVIAAKGARNHLESGAIGSVDLSHADFEVKLMEGDGNPDVPMLPFVHQASNMKELNLLTSGPNAVVLFEAQDQEEYDSWPVIKPGTLTESFKRIPKTAVIDGMECLQKKDVVDVSSKRLQQDIDAGYLTINATAGYTHESVDRKVSRFENGRYYLVDTNNTTVDFVVCLDPTPGKYDKEGLQ